MTNNGPNDAAGVTITDTLPAGVTFVSASAGCNNASGTVTCTIGALANGANAVRTIVVRPTVANPTLSNTATACGDHGRPGPGQQQRDDDDDGQPGAELGEPGPDQDRRARPGLVGGDLTYTLTVTNGGPAAAAGVTITDTLPAGVTFVSASAGCNNVSGTVTCTIGGLANGANAVRTIVVSPTVANPSLSNTATAAATTADPGPATTAPPRPRS